MSGVWNSSETHHQRILSCPAPSTTLHPPHVCHLCSKCSSVSPFLTALVRAGNTPRIFVEQTCTHPAECYLMASDHWNMSCLFSGPLPVFFLSLVVWNSRRVQCLICVTATPSPADVSVPLAVSFYRPSTCNFLFFLLFWTLTHSSPFYRPSTRESIIITISVLHCSGAWNKNKLLNLITFLPLTGCVHSSILTFHVMVWEWDNGHTHSNNRLL